MSEKYPSRHESGAETHSESLKQHRERLNDHHEKPNESKHEKQQRTQEALKEVHEQAVSASEYHKPQSEKRQPHFTSNKAEKEHSFNTTMHHVRNNLSKTERTFSKFVHKPAVEKASEIVGSTVARPSGIAGATIAAFIGLLLVYGIARFAGFELAGSEMPILLLIGFVAGLIIEWIYKSTRSIFGKN